MLKVLKERIIINKESYWTFVRDIDERTQAQKRKAIYRCICGAEKKVIKSNVRSKISTNCGCKNKSKLTDFAKEYNAWRDIRFRCNSTKSPHYKSYGGRGITLCSSWQRSFFNFLDDMGKAPEGFTIERVDNDKGYSKENCVWATWKTQAQNRRSNRFLEINGEKKTVSQWSDYVGRTKGCILSRLRRGMSEKDAVFMTTEEVKKLRYKK